MNGGNEGFSVQHLDGRDWLSHHRKLPIWTNSKCMHRWRTNLLISIVLFLFRRTSKYRLLHQSIKQTIQIHLINFNFPTLVFLHLLPVRLPVKTIRFKPLRHKLINTRFHSLQSTHVHISIFLLE